jgi:hypothetical protein
MQQGYIVKTRENYHQGDLPQNNHFITLQIDGQSPNLFYSNYITETEKSLASNDITPNKCNPITSPKNISSKDIILVICPESVCRCLIFETHI